MTNGDLLNNSQALSRIDSLLGELRTWTGSPSPWRPLQRAKGLLGQILLRAEELRHRLSAPLVVATFGGTGTGKSALVNALAGSSCSPSGRERPTTRKPILVMHEDASLEGTDLNPAEFEIKRIADPLFRSLILIDCPDPDTTESESSGSNLERLRRILPKCDVLIYTTTQQKYHSARINRELALASPACRLILVQTNADLDVDIRHDWKKLLDEKYRVADMFFIDSITAFNERQPPQHPSGDFARLLDLLHEQLADSKHLLIRRENLLGLLGNALEQARRDVDADRQPLAALESALDDQRLRLTNLMGDRLKTELLTHQRLWERRILALVAEYWGISPFSSALRTYNGLGGVLASASLMRARSSAQVAVIGALQGARWFNQRKQEQDADRKLDSLPSLGLDDANLREAQVLIAGYVQDADFSGDAARSCSLDALRNEALRIEDKFLGSASRKMDDLIDRLARQHRRSPVSMACEAIFSLFLVYLLLRIGKNFFWDSAFSSTPILDMNFYLPAFIFTTLLAATLIACFTRTIRESLLAGISSLALEMARNRLADGLFPRLEETCSQVRSDRQRLSDLQANTFRLKSDASPVNLTGRIDRASD